LGCCLSKESNWRAGIKGKRELFTWGGRWVKTRGLGKLGERERGWESSGKGEGEGEKGGEGVFYIDGNAKRYGMLDVPQTVS
jgi:hypothetical protein